jgi:hypothetical protein
MLKNTPKHVEVLYQPNLESTQNQPRFLRLKFWAQVAVAAEIRFASAAPSFPSMQIVRLMCNISNYQ